MFTIFLVYVYVVYWQFKNTKRWVSPLLGAMLCDCIFNAHIPAIIELVRAHTAH